MNYLETIEGCSKIIETKAIDLNILYSGNVTLLEAFFRMIKVPYIWCWIIAIFFTKIWCDFKIFIITLVIYIALFIMGKLLKSWIMYNLKESYNNIKVNMVKNIVENCKELNDMNCPEWQKKQLMKEMSDLGGVSISWNNDK